MRCRRARKLISRDISGLLSGGDAAALEQHLASCADCRRELERLSDAWRALDALAAPTAAPDDWGRIEAALDRKRRWATSWWAPELVLDSRVRAFVLACMVLIGAGAGVLISRPLAARARPGPIEATAVGESLRDLPWDSPAAALERAFVARAPEEETP